MELKSHTVNTISVLQLQGRFDSHTAPAVKNWLEKNVTSETPRAVIDLSAVTFVDSTALAALVYGMKRSRERKGDLYLCGLQQSVRMIFELTRLDRAFEMFTSEDGALKAFAA
jgi:anti-sigma B factor antagonist